MHKKLINEICKKVFNVNENVNIIDRLKLGMSNYMYLIEVNNEKYTFRIPGEYADIFVNRSYELEGLELIKNENLCGDTLYVSKDGIKISKYIEGRVLYLNVKDEDYKKVAEVLHSLHNINAKDFHKYDPFNILYYYEKLNKNNVSEKYLEIKNKLLVNKDLLSKQELVLCHNDAQPSNFVYDNKEKMYLLDYEFIGLNDPLYDVACFGNNNINEGRILLDYYLGRTPTKEEENRYYLWRTFQNLQWVQVALYKHELKMDEGLGLDFRAISEIFLKNAEDAINNIK